MSEFLSIFDAMVLLGALASIGTLFAKAVQLIVCYLVLTRRPW